MKCSPATAAVVVAVAALAGGCSAGRPARDAGPVVAPTSVPVSTTAAAARACLRPPTACSLRQVGDARGVLVGTAVAAGPLRTDETYRARIRQEFNSVTPENQGKWATIEAQPGAADYGALDALVDFAVTNQLKIRGHTLVWDQANVNGTPAWVDEINDPAALRTALVNHIGSEVGRYRGRIDRWDVVNEPFEAHGAALDRNHLEQVLGSAYLALAFETAHDADPGAQLWLNENAFEHLPDKADALVQLVTELVASHVPVSGVGLQAHFLSGRAPPAGAIESLVRRLRRLGVEVAITELDIPLTKRGLTYQAAAYRQVVTECRRAGCNEITVWGVNDSVSWLDAFLGRAGTDPLLFDQRDRPKPAYASFKTALATTDERG